MLRRHSAICRPKSGLKIRHGALENRSKGGKEAIGQHLCESRCKCLIHDGRKDDREPILQMSLDIFSRYFIRSKLLWSFTCISMMLLEVSPTRLMFISCISEARSSNAAQASWFFWSVSAQRSQYFWSLTAIVRRTVAMESLTTVRTSLLNTTRAEDSAPTKPIRSLTSKNICSTREWRPPREAIFVS
jgi:hypothetical protein